jgi:hypothetical protein
MVNCGTYSGYIIHGKNKEKACDPCRLAANKYRREKLAKDNADLGYNPRRFKRHGIDKETYDKLISKYDGKCWVCNEEEAVHIDHNHNCCTGSYSCGKCIRGILCSQCNTGLGLFKDSLDRLEKAIKYLK